MSSAYRAVVFDFFGTLTQAVSRGPAHARIARRLGCDPAAFSRALDITFLRRSVGGYGDPVQALGIVAWIAGGHPDQTTLQSVLAERIDAIAVDIRLRPEAVPVLDTLRRFGFAIGVVSDCGPELPQLMPRLAIAPFVDTYVYSIDVGQRKPDPIMYLTACERLGVKPSDCVYIGDGGSRELSGATAAGMTAFRLAAPDLGTHLAFDVDEDWYGPEIDSLTDVFDALYAVRVPA